jgi:plastocyanin
MAALLAAGVVVMACAAGVGPGWTYAPLGPTPSAGASAPSSSGPAGSGGQGIDVSTTADAPQAFSPAELTAPVSTLVTVHYLNNSNLPHNIHFFAGADQSAPSLGASDVMTGPNAAGAVTFTTPSTPGDYFFWCDVHQTAMKGVLHVQ